MNDDRLQQKNGHLRRCGTDLVLLGSDGLPWVLDGEGSIAAHVGQEVTILGYAYAECRFEVVSIARRRDDGCA